jgi:glutamate 5-kinase
MHKRIVVKVGTSTLTDERGAIDRSYIRALASQIGKLKADGAEVLLVTSGAIQSGIDAMGMTERPKTIPGKQAAAAVGQCALMQIYGEVFGEIGVTVGQILLTGEDFVDRKRYLNVRNTMIALLLHGVVPIVNENDTVAVDEIKVGDNDNLAALVAANLRADLLILLSDVAGLFDAPPDTPGAKIIPMIAEITDSILETAGGAGSDGGTGGMKTKLQAAEVAMNSGISMVIADGRREHILLDIAAGDPIGTTFIPKKACLSERKRWIAFGKTTKGSITVNEGAKKKIILEGKSLLAAGIIKVTGSFSGGDLVRVLDKDGNSFARGFVNYTAKDIDHIKGKRSSEIEGVLGRKDFDEVIHRDNMALKP